MNTTVTVDVIDYNTSVAAKNLNVGMPIVYEGQYSTVTALIADDDRQQVIIQAKGDDDKITRVYYIGYNILVDVGAVTQYGIDRFDRPHIMPVHLKHGPEALSKARAYIRQYGGRIVVRSAVPDDTYLSGGMGVTDWTPLDN